MKNWKTHCELKQHCWSLFINFISDFCVWLATCILLQKCCLQVLILWIHESSRQSWIYVIRYLTEWYSWHWTSNVNVTKASKKYLSYITVSHENFKWLTRYIEFWSRSRDNEQRGKLPNRKIKSHLQTKTILCEFLSR